MHEENKRGKICKNQLLSSLPYIHKIFITYASYFFSTHTHTHTHKDTPPNSKNPQKSRITNEPPTKANKQDNTPEKQKKNGKGGERRASHTAIFEIFLAKLFGYMVERFASYRRLESASPNRAFTGLSCE